MEKTSISYLKTLFEEKDDDVIRKEEEDRIDCILNQKLASLNVALNSKNEDVDEWVRKVMIEAEITCDSCVNETKAKSVTTSNGPVVLQNAENIDTIPHFTNVRKRLALCCIHILYVLDKEVKEDEIKVNSPAGALLGAHDRKLILTAIQFIVSFGVCANLEPGVGPPLAKRSAFGNMLAKEEANEDIDNGFLFICIKAFCRLSTNKEFGQFFISKYLGDIFGSLMQLIFAQKELGKSYDIKVRGTVLRNSGEEETAGAGDLLVDFCNHKKDWCKRELKRLIDSLYQPLVIRELLMLQGFGKPKTQGSSIVSVPKWLQRRCSLFLTNKLMQSNGLKNVLKAIFEEFDMGML